MAGLLDPKEMSEADFYTLWLMRKQAEGNRELQNQISPYEHRAFVREGVKDNPLMAVPYAVMTPLYQLSKLFPELTGNKSRSDPSWNQMGHGLLGIGEGLQQGLLSRLR